MILYLQSACPPFYSIILWYHVQNCCCRSKAPERFKELVLRGIRCTYISSVYQKRPTHQGVKGESWVWSAHVQQRQKGDDDDDAIRLWDVGIYEGTYVPILQYGEIIREERGDYGQFIPTAQFEWQLQFRELNMSGQVRWVLSIAYSANRRKNQESHLLTYSTPLPDYTTILSD
jgi:hypothetical protein